MMLLIYLIIFFLCDQQNRLLYKNSQVFGNGTPTPTQYSFRASRVIFYDLFTKAYVDVHVYYTKKTQLTRARNKLCIKNVYHWYRKKPCITCFKLLYYIYIQCIFPLMFAWKYATFDLILVNTLSSIKRQQEHNINVITRFKYIFLCKIN